MTFDLDVYKRREGGVCSPRVPLLLPVVDVLQLDLGLLGGEHAGLGVARGYFVFLFRFGRGSLLGGDRGGGGGLDGSGSCRR